MRGPKLVLVLLLTGVLFIGALVGQLVLGIQLTMLNSRYILDEAHRQGVFAVVYAGAAEFISNESTDLSAADRDAARTALRKLIDDRALERLATVATAEVQRFMAGDITEVVLDLTAAKDQVRAEFRLAGGSEAALARLEESLTGSPDSVVLMDRYALDGTPLDPLRIWRASLGVVLGLAALGLVLILAAGGLANGLVWSGAGLAASAAVLLSLLGRGRTAVTSGTPAWPTALTQLPLDHATIVELEASLAGLLARVFGQLSIVPWVTLVAGMAMVVGGVMLVRRSSSPAGRAPAVSQGQEQPASGAPTGN